MWRRYRFQTHSTKDNRPIIFNPEYPWWCSGCTDYSVIIVAYLPETEKLTEYWDDAFDVTWTEEEKIVFTDRFPKPDYFVETETIREKTTPAFDKVKVEAGLLTTVPIPIEAYKYLLLGKFEEMLKERAYHLKVGDELHIRLRLKVVDETTLEDMEVEY
jgi:hypothetical protein